MRSEAWRPAAAARNRSPREAREVARQALWLRRARYSRIRVMPETQARPRVKNRHGGAPRGERPASWDARRLASAWRAALCARPTGAAAPERLSALRPPSFGVSEARMQTPGAENAPRERDGLFDMVNCAASDAHPHPEERACRRNSANSNARTRVSKDEDGRALMLRDASRRAWAVEVPARACGRDAPQHEGKHQPAAVRNDCRLGFPVSGLLFTGNAATATCRASQRPSRIHVPARLPTRSRSPINPPNTGSTPMPRTTLASRVRSPSQSSP